MCAKETKITTLFNNSSPPNRLLPLSRVPRTKTMHARAAADVENACAALCLRAEVLSIMAEDGFEEKNC